MPHNQYVERFISAIGPFYEYVNEDDVSTSNDDQNENDEVARSNKKNTSGSHHVMSNEDVSRIEGGSIEVRSKCFEQNGHHQQVNGKTNSETNGINGSYSKEKDEHIPSGI